MVRELQDELSLYISISEGQSFLSQRINLTLECRDWLHVRRCDNLARVNLASAY
jgi:hypothetical protein